MKAKKIILFIGAITLIIFTACKKDFLDKQPLSNLTPENFFNQESDLASYTINLSINVFPTEGNPFASDRGTDAMTNNGIDNRYLPGNWKVDQDGGDWNFDNIHQCNYFLQTVLPKYNSNKITGVSTAIKHDIGEMYVLRAFEYFKKLKSFGDFPIIRTSLPDDAALLTEASKRQPQTEVARFILSDLDSAIMLLQDVSPDGARNRLNKNCAYLLKSRVALYEGTWLKYFKNTPFVPNGPDWPGATKDYNKNYAFQSGSIDAESLFFLNAAKDAAKVVADAIPLTINSGTIQQSTTQPVNPYFNMFSDVDMSSYKEVMLWRRYDKTLSVVNGIAVEMGYCNSGVGFTRGMVDGFLMANGLPIYAAGSGYAGDDSIGGPRVNRDNRLYIFLKQPKQKNILFGIPGDHATITEPKPDLTNVSGHSNYPTGYAPRKGLSYDGAQYGNGQSWEGEIIFRAVEAYLNYMEASVEISGSLDADATKYWQAIRTRAKVSTDLQNTITNTDLKIAATNDWAVLSGNVPVKELLYNIRLERKNELFGEGFRLADLRRWRSMDQMKTTPYQIEGFKIWGPIQKLWPKGFFLINAGGASTMSDSALSKYIRVFQRDPGGLLYKGYTFTMAHYLNNIAIHHFILTSKDGLGDVTTSPIYQNPGWGLEPNVGASNLPY